MVIANSPAMLGNGDPRESLIKPWNFIYRPRYIMEEADFELCVDIERHAAAYRRENTANGSSNEYEEALAAMVEQSNGDDVRGRTRRRLPVEEISSDEDSQRKPPAKKKAKSEVEVDDDCVMSDQATCASDETFYEHLPVPPSTPFISFIAGELSSPEATVSPGGPSSAIQFALSPLAIRRGQGEQQLNSPGRRRHGLYADFRIYEDPSTPGAIDPRDEDGSTVPFSSSSSSYSPSDEKENLMETDTEDGEVEPQPGTGDHGIRPAVEGRVLHTGAHESRIVLGMFEGPTFPNALRELRVPGPLDFNGRNQQYRGAHQNGHQRESEDGDDEEEESDWWDTNEEDQQVYLRGAHETGRHVVGQLDNHWLSTSLQNNNNEGMETPSTTMGDFHVPSSVAMESLERHIAATTTTTSTSSPLLLSAMGQSPVHRYVSAYQVPQLHNNAAHGHIVPYGRAFTSPSTVAIPAHIYDHYNGHNTTINGHRFSMQNSSPIHNIHRNYPWELAQPISRWSAGHLSQNNNTHT